MTLTFFACCLFLQSLTPEVIEHAQAGAAAREQGKIDVAIQEFRKVTELQPKSAVGHADLGDAYFHNGDYGPATTELELALQLNSDLLAAHQTLGVLLLMQGDAEAALPHLEKMHTPELMGLAYLNTGRLSGAIAALHDALEARPGDPNLLYYFGRAAALDAKQSFARAAKLNPDLAHASGAPADDGKLPHDLAALQNALALQPNDAELLLAFSRAASLASKKAFDQILQANPNSPRAHQVLAERSVETGHLLQAEREYVESIRLNTNASNVHLALGDLLAREGKRAAAVAQYRMETQLQPLNAAAFYSLGATLLEERQAGSAVVELIKADHIKPNTPYILLTLGGAALEAHDDARAEASWTKLLSIDQKSNLAAKAHLGLSAVYRRAGKSQEADREKAAYEQLNTEGVH